MEKTHNADKSMGMLILVGVIIAIVCCVSLSALTAFMIQNQWLNEESLGRIRIVILFVSVFLCCIITGRKSKGYSAIQYAITTLTFFIVLMLINLCALGGNLQKAGGTILACAAGCAAAALAMGRRPKKKKYKYR